MVMKKPILLSRVRVGIKNCRMLQKGWDKWVIKEDFITKNFLLYVQKSWLNINRFSNFEPHQNCGVRSAATQLVLWQLPPQELWDLASEAHLQHFMSTVWSLTNSQFIRALSHLTNQVVFKNFWAIFEMACKAGIIWNEGVAQLSTPSSHFSPRIINSDSFRVMNCIGTRKEHKNRASKTCKIILYGSHSPQKFKKGLNPSSQPSTL